MSEEWTKEFLLETLVKSLMEDAGVGKFPTVGDALAYVEAEWNNVGNSRPPAPSRESVAAFKAAIPEEFASAYAGYVEPTEEETELRRLQDRVFSDFDDLYWTDDDDDAVRSVLCEYHLEESRAAVDFFLDSHPHLKPKPRDPNIILPYDTAAILQKLINKDS